MKLQNSDLLIDSKDVHPTKPVLNGYSGRLLQDETFEKEKK
jgi:hypothetical protein